MGRPGHKSSALVAVSLDSSGSIQTDMIVKQGTNKNRLVQSKMDDIREKVCVVIVVVVIVEVVVEEVELVVVAVVGISDK